MAERVGDYEIGAVRASLDTEVLMADNEYAMHLDDPTRPSHLWLPESLALAVPDAVAQWEDKNVFEDQRGGARGRRILLNTGKIRPALDIFIPQGVDFPIIRVPGQNTTGVDPQDLVTLFMGGLNAALSRFRTKLPAQEGIRQP